MSPRVKEELAVAGLSLLSYAVMAGFAAIVAALLQDRQAFISIIAMTALGIAITVAVRVDRRGRKP